MRKRFYCDLLFVILCMTLMQPTVHAAKAIRLQSFTDKSAWVVVTSFEIPEEGFYHFVVDGKPMRLDVDLDGHFFYHLDQGGRDRKKDDKGRFTETVYLTRGLHQAQIRGHVNWMYWGTVREMLKTVSFGFEKIEAPEQTLTIREKNRDDMVFERGEPLVLRFEEWTKDAASYTVTVSPQRGGNNTIAWTTTVTLPAQQPHATADASYPCDTEGAFEYVVRDSTGQIVQGPWAFVVVDSTPAPLPKADKTDLSVKTVLVDQVDCTKADDSEHHFRDNGTSVVMSSPSGSYRVTGPAYLQRNIAYVPDEGFEKSKHGPYRRAKEGEKAPQGVTGFIACDWFAYSLKVKHPGMPHLLTVYVPTDARRATILAAIDPVTISRNCAVLEVGDNLYSEKLTAFSLPVWPNADYIDVLVGNFGRGLHCTQGAVAKMELSEVPGGLPAMAEAAAGWAPKNQFGYYIEQRDLGIERFTMPKWWNGDKMVPRIMDRNEWGRGGTYDWKAMYEAWTRAASHARFMGDNLIIYGAHTYSMELFKSDLKPGGRLIYDTGYQWRLMNRAFREPLPMILKIFNQYRLKIVLDMMIQRLEPEHVQLLDPDNAYPHDNIMLTDLSGSNRVLPASLALNPAHPLARKYLVSFYGEIAARFGKYQSFGGINIRQDHWGNTMSGWFINDRIGYDDFTTKLFAIERNVDIPFFSAEDKDRYKKRFEWLKANAWDKWMDWRCDKVESLLAEINAAVQKHAPDAQIYSNGAANFDNGGGLKGARLAGNRALGFDRSEILGGEIHIEVNQLDPVCFKNLDISPIALDAPKQINDLNKYFSYQGSIVTGRGSSIRPYPYDLRKASDILAETTVDRFIYGGMWVPPTVGKGRRQLPQAWRAIPKVAYEKTASAQSPDGLVACWQARVGSNFYFYLVNRSAVSQTVSVNLQGLADTVHDLVSGQTLSPSKLNVTIDPYMLRVFSAPRASGVTAVQVQPNQTYLAGLRAQMEQLQVIGKIAEGVTHKVPNHGGDFILTEYGKHTQGIWQKKDLSVNAASLALESRKAWDEKRYFDLDRMLEGILTHQPWWYEVYGWPEGIYQHQQPQGEYQTPQQLGKGLVGDTGTLQEYAGAPGTMRVFKNGQATLKVKSPVADKYDLLVWMMSGGNLGPVEISLCGKAIGRLGISGGTPAYGRFRTATPLPLPAGDLELTLRNTTGGPLVLQTLEVSKVEPEILTQWQAVGLFDKASSSSRTTTDEGFSTIFGPEKIPANVDLNAEFSGLDDKPVKWHAIDMGEDKFIQLLEKFFPYEYKQANGIAYLATWVQSPEDRLATFYYSVDWFAKLWVNGEVVKEDIQGPWGNWATTPVSLRKGWNCILIKTATGSDGWRANFALSNPGDLQFSQTPQQ